MKGGLEKESRDEVAKRINSLTTKIDTYQVCTRHNIEPKCGSSFGACGGAHGDDVFTLAVEENKTLAKFTLRFLN